MSRVDSTAPVRLQTSEMAYGPHAVARHEGKVVFIRGAAPDEEVDVVITEERRSFAFAEVVDVIRPSLNRRQPPCPYLPRCGGCPWQHLDYAAQLEAKRHIVQDHLRRLAGVAVDVEPVLPSPREYEYRRRLKLRIEDGEVGFYAGATHSLVPIEHCLLAEPAVGAAIPWAAELARGLQSNLRRIELVRAGEETAGVCVVAEAEGGWVKADHARCRAWLSAHERVRGLTISGRRWKHSWGKTEVTLRPDTEIVLHANAGSFTQVNSAANLSLVDTVGRLSEVRSGERVLDLYAGVGNLSLPLALRGAHVFAVEQHPEAARDNAANARRLGLTNYEVRQGPAERVVGRLADAEERFDVVVLDPPRSGARAVIDSLLRLAAPRVIYVSCDPATLARDVGALREQYRIDTVQPIDMFPHSYHVEVVLRAELAMRIS
jgi:23S rRNA (uracil1939-C5)-methyltransferase